MDPKTRKPLPVKIGPHEFQVSFAPPNELRSEELIGRMNPVTTTITIPKEASNTCRQQILLHEVTHAILSNYSIIKDGVEEWVCEMIATSFLTFIQDNPEWVGWFLGRRSSYPTSLEPPKEKSPTSP